MSKKETNVTAGGASSAPAKTAENSTAAGAAGELSSARQVEGEETPVSPEIRRAVHAVVTELVPSLVGEYLFANPPTIGLKQIEDIGDRMGLLVKELTTDVEGEAIALSKEYTDNAIAKAKAEILAHVGGLVTPIVTASAAAADKPAAPSRPAHVLADGDPVRIYQDAERKNFYTGSIVKLHDGGHAADVKLNELGGAVSTVRVEALEYDDRA